MNELTCEQTDEFAPAAALSGDPEYGGALASHLRGCARDHADTRELLAMVDGVAAAALPVRPPPGLRDRVMASVAATPQEDRAASRSPLIGQGNLSRERDWLAWLRPGLARGIALAAIPVVVALALVVVRLQSDLSARNTTLAAVAQALSRGQQVEAVKGTAGGGYLVESSDGRATLLAADLDHPPSGHLYEMWLIDAAGVAMPAGTFLPGDGGVSVIEVVGSVTDAATFAVTVETKRVDHPTSDPVLVAALTQ